MTDIINKRVLDSKAISTFVCHYNYYYWYQKKSSLDDHLWLVYFVDSAILEMCTGGYYHTTGLTTGIKSNALV